jgi:hypothetical protein
MYDIVYDTVAGQKPPLQLIGTCINTFHESAHSAGQQDIGLTPICFQRVQSSDFPSPILAVSYTLSALFTVSNGPALGSSS